MTYIYGLDRDQHFISRNDLEKRESKKRLDDVKRIEEAKYKLNYGPGNEAALTPRPPSRSSGNRLSSALIGAGKWALDSPVSPTSVFSTPYRLGASVVESGIRRDLDPVKREFIDRPKQLGSALLSGEKAVNLAYPGNLGTVARKQIERVPKIGRPAAQVADIATSPLTIATAGGAGALAGGGSKLGQMLAPIAGRSFGTRLAAETGIGAAALAGSELAGRGAEELGAPGPVVGAAALAGGLAGGIGGVRGARKAFGAATLAGSDPNILKGVVREDGPIDPRTAEIMGIEPKARLSVREPGELRSVDEVLANREVNETGLAIEDVEHYLNWAREDVSNAQGAVKYALDNDLSDDILREAQQALKDAVRDESSLTRELARRQVTSNLPDDLSIGGGSVPRSLIKFKKPESKILPTERARDIVNRGLRQVAGVGVTENLEATPIVRESKSITGRMGNLTRQLGAIGQGAEHALDVDPKTGISRQFGESIQDIAWDFSKYESKMNSDQLLLMQTLRDKQELLTQIALDSGILKEEDLLVPKDPRGFWLTRWGTVRDVPPPELLPKFAKAPGEAGFEKSREFQTMRQGRAAGYQYPSYSNAAESYGKALAERVKGEYAKPYTKGLKEYAEEQGIPTGGRVDVGGEVVTDLPPAWADTLNREFGTKQRHDSEFTHIVSAVNTAGKTVWASVDASWMGIQGLLTAAVSPRRAGKALALSLRSQVDPEFKALWMAKKNKELLAVGKPTLDDWAAANLHFAGSKGEGLDIRPVTEGAIGKVTQGKYNPIRASNQLFSDMGDFNRMLGAELYYNNLNLGKKVMFQGIEEGTAESQLDEIAAAVNRATGYSDTAFGGDVGKIALFAPKFLQSQLEVLVKSFSDGGVEGAIARQQLIRLFGFGIGLTFTANAIKTGSTDPMDWASATELNPTSSNFMRIRDVGGADVSIFGPWDSLIRGIVATVQGDTSYIPRSKASPIVSKGWDLITGKDFLGKNTRDPENFIRSLFPFSVREAGEEPLVSTLIGMLGIKSSPLSSKEKVDQALSNAGIERSDPEYLIKRREYIAKNPDIVPSAVSDKGKKAQEITTNTRSREKANSDKTLDDTQTLVEFRENRKDLNTANRIRLEEAVGKFKDKPSTKQEKWVSTYFNLYEQSKDDINPDKVDSDKLDPLVAKWINDNGEEALDFVRRYTQAGQTEVDKQYLIDLATLDRAGYFDINKYQHMKSDLSSESIDNYRGIVSAARSSDPKLSAMSFGAAANRVLRERGLTRTQIQDVIRAGSDAFKSREYLAMKRKYGKELLWFNDNTRWSNYQNYKPKGVRVSSALKR